MHPFPLASVFTYGMRRDADRTQLPGGSVYNLVDFIPDEISAAAEGRGGWTYAGSTFSGATQIRGAGYYETSDQVIMVDQVNKVWNVLGGGASIGTLTSSLTAPPFFHRKKLILPVGGQPQYYDGAAVGTLTGAPTGTADGTPQFVGCAYKDHTVLANSSTNTNRVWFSAAGDPTTWDLTYGWWDTTGTIYGIAATPNAILIFHHDSTERLRGTTPPPGSDMVLEPFFNDGCIDPYTVAYWNQRVIWASSRGIYLTDGVSVVDLTADAQMKSYWTSLMASYATTWRIAGGIYRDHYIISINNGSTLVDCLCVNLKNRAMWRFTNLHGSSFVNVTASKQEKLYMGQWNAGRVAELSSLWSPSSTVKQDGDATNPTPIIETGSYRGYDRLHRRWIQSYGKQKWRWAYLDYDLRDSATDTPTITLSYATTPTGGYTASAGGTIAATTDYGRVRRTLNTTQGGATRADMLELKLAVNGPYAHARIYAVECDFSPIDIGRLN